MVVVWNTLNVGKGGEVTILAKAHTDVDIHTMKVAFFDDTRYPHFTFVLFCVFDYIFSQLCMFVYLRMF